MESKRSLTSFEPSNLEKFTSASQKRKIFKETLKQEFIRELYYLQDVANNRATARDTFMTVLVEQIKNITSLTPVIGDAIDRLSSVVDFAAKQKRDSCIGRVANIAYQLDPYHLDILMEIVAKEALRRYEAIIDRLSDDVEKSAIPFAKVGARRMLEKLSRSTSADTKDHCIALNESTLLAGLVEGRSGSFVEGFSNTSLTLKKTKKKLLVGETSKKIDAEDCYARAGMRFIEIKNGNQIDMLFVRRTAKHQEIPTWEKLSQAFKGRPEAFYNFGYVRFRKEYKNDPKPGYVIMPMTVIQDRYEFKLQDVIKGTSDCGESKEKISDELKTEVLDFKPSIIIVDKATIEKFLIWSKDNVGTSLLDYVKIISKNPCVEQVVCHDSLVGLNLKGANLSHADLSGSEISGDLTDTDFSESYLIGTTFTNITSTKGTNFHKTHAEFLQAEDTHFSEASFTLANLSYSKLKNITNCKTTGSVWLKAEFKEELNNSDIIKTQQEQTELFNTLEKKLNKLSQDLNIQQEKQSQLDQKIEQELKTLEQKLAKADKSELEQLQKQIHNLQQQLKQNQENINTLNIIFENEKSEIKKQINKLDDAHQALQEIIDKLNSQLQSKLDAAEKSQEEQYQQLKSDLATLEQKLNARIAALEGRVEKLETDRIEFKVQVQTLEIKEAKLKTKVDKLEQKVTALSTKIISDSKDKRAKPLSTVELERLAPELINILKAYYNSKDTVTSLLSTRPQPIADINLTITEHKQQIKQSLNLDAKEPEQSVSERADEKKNTKNKEQKEIIGGVEMIDASKTLRDIQASIIKEKELEQKMLETYEKSYTEQESIALEAIFDEGLPSSVAAKTPKHILISGKAGVGKTTMSQCIANRWGMLAHNHIDKDDEKESQKSKFHSGKSLWAERFDFVFWIPLRNLSDYKKNKNVSLAEIIHQECCALEQQRKKQFIQVINYVLRFKKERCLILLDGADEIAHQIIGSTHNPIKRILQQAFSAEYLILTSRPYQAKEVIALNHKGFDRELENIGFIDKQIELYIRNYFKPIDKDESLTNDLLKVLNNNPRIWGTAHTPIHLSLICSAWEDRGRTKIFNEKMNVTALYCEITHHLLRHALNKKSIDTSTQGEVWCNQRCEKEMLFLERLAFIGLKNGKINLDSELLNDAINTVQRKIENASDDSAINSLYVTALKIGFLKKENGESKEKSKCNHYFIHLTFQEFLAARYLLSCLKGSDFQQKEAAKFIHDYKYTGRYQVLLGFVAGLASKEEQHSISLVRFWKTLLAPPLDLTSIGYWRIVLRCLEEAECNERIPHIEKILKSSEKFFIELIQTDWNYVEIREHFFSLLEYYSLISRHTRITELIVNVFASKNIRAKLNTLNTLKKLPKKEIINFALKALQKASDDSDRRVRETATDILKRLKCEKSSAYSLDGLDEYKSVEILPAKLHHSLHALNPETFEMMATKEMRGKYAIKDLLRIIKDGNESNSNREAAVSALYSLEKKEITDSVLDTLLKATSIKNINITKITNTLEILCSKLVTDYMTEDLLIATKHSNRYIRKAAIDALGKLGVISATSSVINALLKALEDSSYAVVKAATDALGNFGENAATDPVISVLMNMVSHNNDDIRKASIDALEKLCEKKVRNYAIDDLLKAITHDNEHIRKAVINALEKLEEKAATNSVFTALLNATKDINFDVRCTATNLLEKLCERAAKNYTIEELLKAIVDHTQYVRKAAADALGNLGENAATPPVINALVKTLDDQNHNIKKAAVNALGKLGEKAATDSVIDALTNALEDSNNCVKKAAANTLGKLGEKATRPSIINALVKALNNDSRGIRSIAADTLGKLGENAATPSVIKALVKTLDDCSHDVKKTAADALGKLGEKSITSFVINALLRKVLYDPNDETRQAAANILDKMGEKLTASSAIKSLIKAAGSSNIYVSRAASYALIKTNEEKAAIDSCVIHAFMNAMNDSNIYVRSAALSSLEKMDRCVAVVDCTINNFLKATYNGISSTFNATAGTLSNADEKTVINFITCKLLVIARNSSSDIIRRSAANALAKLHEKMLSNKTSTKAMIEVSAKSLKIDGLTNENSLQWLHLIHPELVVLALLKEIGSFWLWYNDNIKEFLETTHFSVAILVKIYLENPHDVLPEIIAINALRQGISITLAEKNIYIHNGTKPYSFPATPKQSRELAKAFSAILKKTGLSNAIPEAYVDEENIYPPLHSVPSTSSTTKTLQRLEVKASYRPAATSSATATTITERKTEATPSRGQTTLILKQSSTLLQQQQAQNKLLARASTTTQAEEPASTPQLT